MIWLILPGVVAETVECEPRVRKIGSSVPGRVKPMADKIYLSLPSQLFSIIRIGQDWLAQHLDNVTGRISGDGADRLASQGGSTI